MTDPTQRMPATGGRPERVLDGRYVVLELIGEGGVAEVFRGHDTTLGRDVALKLFRAPTAAGTAGDAQRQRIELRTLAGLNHPNLVALFDGSPGRPGQPAYLVLELVVGDTLADRIRDSGLTLRDIHAVAVQVAGALAYVHARGMVHRDVKPANILIGRDASAPSGSPDRTDIRARLSDFGIVRLLDEQASITGTQLTVGSAQYLAPEQAQGSAVGPSADVYALGLVLLEALTGRRAFDGPPMAVAAARLERDPWIPPDLPGAWDRLLRAMTARDAARRPTAAQVATMLREDGADPTAVITPPRRPAVVVPPPARPVPPPPTVARSASPPRSAPPPRGYPGPSYASAPRPNASRTGFGWAIAVLVVLVVLVAVVVGLVVFFARSGGGATSPTTPTPTPTPTPTGTASTATTSRPSSSTSAPTTSSSSSTPSSSTSTSSSVTSSSTSESTSDTSS